MTTTNELCEWLDAESVIAKDDDCPVAAAYLKDAANHIRAQEARITALTKVADPEPIGYMQKVIEALYENGDPVSIDAAELLERVSTVTTQWQLIETAPQKWIHACSESNY